MEDIYLDRKVDTEEIGKKLHNLFPSLSVFYYDFKDIPPTDLDIENSNQIFFNTYYQKEKLEFGFTISIYRTPDENSNERAMFIAKSFSDSFKVRTLVPYILPQNPQDPYYDIIFDNGKIFLADDCSTSFGDDTDGIIKIIKEYNLNIYSFDSYAKMSY
ncbi:hypothetical protein ACFQO9_05405 [Chryseobacterium zhengzhouense]|uniref:Uncharacterized protein n=1 Tax=Chryseobacterium zhengzhouense TaxID=1636086 RepID=A0ABW2LYA6_9FLAO